MKQEQLVKMIRDINSFRAVRRGRPRKGEPTAQSFISIKVYQPLYGSLDRLSRKQGRDIADIAREAIMVYLIKYMTLEEMVAPEKPTEEQAEPINGQEQEQ